MQYVRRLAGNTGEDNMFVDIRFYPRDDFDSRKFDIYLPEKAVRLVTLSR